MPRTRSLAFAQLKIGILAVVALVIAAMVIFMLSGQGGFFWQRYSLKVRLPNAAGLKSGAPVRLAGVEVGSVTDLEFVGAQVDVTLQVGKVQQPRITSASKATIGAMGLLGQATVDISAATTGTPIPAWGYVPTGVMPQQLADVAATANKGVEEATALLHDIRQGRGTVGQLFTNERLYDEFARFVASAQEVVNGLNRGQGTFGELMKDPATARSLKASADNLRAITASIAAGEGALGKLLHDEQLAASLKSTTGNMASVADGLARGQGSAGKFLKDEELFNRLSATARQLDELTARLNAGEGSAGQFLKNKELYDKLSSAVDDMKGLIADIRKDPKKYLNVRVSVF
jgi:phospholipid/cholesterol/gamma-HCH transport system substrate-binding protein